MNEYASVTESMAVSQSIMDQFSARDGAFQEGPGAASGLWVDQVAYYSIQDSPKVAQAVTDGMAKRGYLVEQIHVPTDSEITGALVVVKVGLPFSDQGPPDPDLVYAALTASLGRFTSPLTGAADTAGQVGDQVVKPTLEKAGLGLGTILLVGGVLYLGLLVSR